MLFPTHARNIKQIFFKKRSVCYFIEKVHLDDLDLYVVMFTVLVMSVLL